MQTKATAHPINYRPMTKNIFKTKYETLDQTQDYEKTKVAFIKAKFDTLRVCFNKCKL